MFLDMSIAIDDITWVASFLSNQQKSKSTIGHKSMPKNSKEGTKKVPKIQFEINLHLNATNETQKDWVSKAGKTIKWNFIWNDKFCNEIFKK